MKNGMKDKMKTKKRPKSVVVITIFSILVFALLFAHVIRNVASPPAVTALCDLMRLRGDEAPAFLRGAFSLYRHYDAVGSVELLFSVFILVSALRFFRLRSWARRALFVSLLVVLVSLIIYVAFWVLLVMLLPDVMSSLLGGVDEGVLYRGFGLVVLLIILFGVAPLTAGVLLLRSKKVKDAVAQGGF
jgi:hypothetical protein